MPDKTISNPGGLWGATADPMEQRIVHAVNNSGGTLLPGDVVILSGTGGDSVTTTTTADSPLVCGVVAPSEGGLRTVASTETVASGAVCPIVVQGPARVNIGALTVAANAVLATSTTVKCADDSATPVAGCILGVSRQAQGSKDANNTILAFIKLA